MYQYNHLKRDNVVAAAAELVSVRSRIQIENFLNPEHKDDCIKIFDTESFFHSHLKENEAVHNINVGEVQKVRSLFIFNHLHPTSILDQIAIFSGYVDPLIL